MRTIRVNYVGRKSVNLNHLETMHKTTLEIMVNGNYVEDMCQNLKRPCNEVQYRSIYMLLDLVNTQRHQINKLQKLINEKGIRKTVYLLNYEFCLEYET